MCVQRTGCGTKESETSFAGPTMFGLSRTVDLRFERVSLEDVCCTIQDHLFVEIDRFQECTRIGYVFFHSNMSPHLKGMDAASGIRVVSQRVRKTRIDFMRKTCAIIVGCRALRVSSQPARRVAANGPIREAHRILPPDPDLAHLTRRVIVQQLRRFAAAGLKPVVSRRRTRDAGRVNVFETTWFSIYCSDSPPSTRCIDDRSSGGRRRATTSSCESSGVPVVGPGASWRVVFDGGLIHTAVGKVSGRGGPLTNRSGCAA